MATSVELRQERARTVEAMREINERAEGENRNLDAVELESYNKGEAEFRNLSERIERQELMERSLAESAQSVNSQTGVPGSGGSESRAKDIRSAFLAFARGVASGEQRALVENAVGEVLVPAEMESEMVRDLPNESVIRPLASVRTTTSNRKRRRSITEATVGWGKLETSTTQDAQDFESTPTPSEATWIYVENLNGLVRVGEDELQDSDLNLEAFLRDSFSRALAAAQDTAFVLGTGHANLQPQGIFSTGSGIAALTSGATNYGATTANAPGVILDDLKTLSYQVNGKYRKNGVYLMNETTELFIATLKDTTGHYLWQPSLAAGRPSTFNGFAIHTQSDIDAIAANKTIAAFGDVAAGYQVLDHTGMQIQRLNELYAENGMVGFRLRARVGGAPDRPKALHLLKTKAA